MATIAIITLQWVGVCLGQSELKLSEQTEIGFPEKYKLKMLIFAKWGNNPGEVNMKMYEGDPRLPLDFNIDKEDNIFILDMYNNRVQKYDKNGKFILSFRAVEKPIDSTYIPAHLNEKDNITASKKNFYKYEIGIDHIIFDENESIYIPQPREDEKSDFISYKFEKNGKKIGTVETSSIEKYDKYPRGINYSLENISKIYYKGREYNIEVKDGISNKMLNISEIINSEQRLINVINLGKSDELNIIGYDKEGAIYILKLNDAIYKYSIQGILLVKIPFYQTGKGWQKYCSWPKINIMKNGDIYCWGFYPQPWEGIGDQVFTPDASYGMTLLKWQKQ
jgi:hypothetical protein